jgi:glutamate dehydrogenase
VPRAVSIKVDARTRVLQKAMIEGVLSVPAEQLRSAGGVAELTRLFSLPETVERLMPTDGQAEADLTPELRPAFAHAWKAVDAIEAVATFVFSALSVTRPSDMDLAAFLQVGMALRNQAGIDTLERGLKLVPQSKSQEQLRNYAQHALRRTQQRLLTQVLERAAGGGDAGAAVEVVTNTLGLSGYAVATDLEQAMLDVWALSEATTAVVA